MQEYDVWMAIIVACECARLGYEASRTDEIGAMDFPGRLFTSASTVILLVMCWAAAQ